MGNVFISGKNIYKIRSIFKTIKYLALKKIITDNKENNIKVFFLENDIASILKSEFKNKKINFVKSTFSIKEKIIKILRQRKLFHFLFFSYFFFKNFKFKNYNFKFFLKKKYLIFSYFTHYDEKRFFKKIFYPKQWSTLWESISGKSNFLQIFIPDKKYKFYYKVESLLKKDKYENLKKENFINNFIFYKSYLKVFKDFKFAKSKILFSEIKKNLKKDRNFNYFFRLNEEEFISSFSGYILLQNLLWINTFENLFKNIPKHEYGIYTFENQPWEKAFISCWNKYKNGKLIGYCHTTINFWHLNYFNINQYNLSKDFDKYSPNLIATSSEISKNFLLNQSINPKRIIDVEALRYNWILDKRASLDKKKIEERKILFLGDYEFNINQKLIEILNQSKDELINLGFEISYKPHPASIAKENFINKVKLTNEDLEYLIETHKYIVSSNSTSAIIEALSCGRKTFLFIDKSNFDLSPIKNTKIEKKVDFFYTKKI